MTLKKSATGVLNPLPKGRSCSTCKARKVRCDAQLPACSSCLRSAKFSHRDLSLVCCQYKEKKEKKGGKSSTRGNLKIGDGEYSEGGKVKKIKKDKSVKHDMLDEVEKDHGVNTNLSIITSSTSRCSYPPLDYSLATFNNSVASSSNSNSTHSHYSRSNSNSESGYYTPIDSPTNSLLDFDHPYISTPSSSTFNSTNSFPEIFPTTTNSYLPQHSFYHPQYQQQSTTSASSLVDPTISYTNTSNIAPFLPQSINPNPTQFIIENENFPSTTANLNFGGNDKIEFEGYFGIDGLLASGKGSYEGVWTQSWNPGMWC